MRRSKNSEAVLAQYEIPAFQAGALIQIVGSIDELLALHQRNRGTSPMLDTAREFCAIAKVNAYKLQRAAAAITNYDYAAELVAEEGSLSAS